MNLVQQFSRWLQKVNKPVDTCWCDNTRVSDKSRETVVVEQFHKEITYRVDLVFGMLQWHHRLSNSVIKDTL